VAILLALGAALSYGLSDFVGGLVSRRTSAWAVAVVGGASSVVFTGLTALFFTGSPRPVDFAWATVAGIGSGVGVGFLYRGFATGRMSVVAPVSAVGAALVPVLFGVVGGERPGGLVWLGIVLAAPAIWLVSSVPPTPEDDSTPLRDGLLDGVLAGLGFGLLFACIGQVPRESGMVPLAFTQLVSVPAVVLLATALHTDWVPRDRAVGWAALTGPLGGSANLLFLLATQRGYLTVSAVLTSLYPASTVVLAALVLREQIHRAQAVGLALCAVTVTLVAVG
jgi:drug/metabolite transporter (DMT)-like permease